MLERGHIIACLFLAVIEKNLIARGLTRNGGGLIELLW